MERSGVLVALLLCVLYHPSGVRGQADILSISSFQDCVSVDPSARANGTGKFLDCTGQFANEYDTVTIMDLRLQAGTTGPEAFIISLTTLRPTNSSSQTSDDPRGCSPDFRGDGSVIPTDCQLTNTTYAIRIESTEYIYYYDLELDETVGIPYCHVVHTADTATKVCNAPTYKGASSGYAGFTASCDTRVQQIHKCTGSGSPRSDNAADCAYWMDRFSTDNIYTILTGNLSPTAGAPFATIQEYSAAHADTSTNECTVNNPGEYRCIRTEFSSDALRKPAPARYKADPITYGDWNDYSSLALGEVLSAGSWTNHTLAIPSPLPLGLDQSGKFNPKDGLQILNCLGKCESNKQNCYNGYDYPGINTRTIRTNGTVLGSAGLDIGMFALGPTCSVYRAQLNPQVAMRVTLTMTDLSTNITTTVVTDNVRPGSQESDDLKQIGFEIISIGSLNNVLGPPLGGAFLVCGDAAATYKSAEGKSFKYSPKSDIINPPSGETNLPDSFFPNMRTQMAPKVSVDDVLYNPWDNIIATAQTDTKVYYPSNRYMSYNQVCNANGGTIDDGSGRECTQYSYMWYYIPPDALHTIGRGCGQLGVTDAYWNVVSNIGQETVSQFAADVCNSDPFICAPGFQANVQVQEYINATGSQVSSTFISNLAVSGCMASTAWEIEHITKGTLRDPNSPGGERGGYWRTAQPLEPGSNEFSGQRLTTQESQFSYTLHDTITSQYTPPDYIPEHPNYWFQKEYGTEFVEGFRVYYAPNPDRAAKFPLSFEMTVYFVGKFLAYGDIVPSGLIVQGGCATDPDHELFSNLFVQIKNTGKTPGDYTLNIDCPPATLVTAVPSTLPFSNVTAGTLSEAKSFYLQPYADADPTLATDDCILTLLPTADVFSVLDSQDMQDCSYTQRDITPTPPPGNPYVPGPGKNGTSCGFCDFQCWHDTSGILGCFCFWFIVVPFVLFFTMLTVTGVMFFRHRVKNSVAIKEGKERRERNQREGYEKMAMMTPMKEVPGSDQVALPLNR